MTNYADQVDIDIFIQKVYEPKIATDPLVEKLNLVEKENEYLKEKMKRIENEKMKLELYVTNVVDDHKIKMDAMRLKIGKIRKYAIDNEGLVSLCCWINCYLSCDLDRICCCI